ncbi:MAG: corrinoid protein [Chloroflexota bacterium]|nr:corrinoid protein [Chloroflexota bacterium]
MSEVLELIKQAIIDGDDAAAKTATERAVSEHIAPANILNSGIMPGIETAGQLWSEGQYFMPDVILSAEAFKLSSSVVEPLLKSGDAQILGVIAIGVVSGDMHDLGISIVTSMLRGAGFEVVELGIDVPVDVFVEAVRKNNVDIIGMGAYMSTTMLVMKEVIQKLKDENLRDKVKVLVGGVPLTQEYADEIGADAWGKDAIDAVVKAKRLKEVN